MCILGIGLYDDTVLILIIVYYNIDNREPKLLIVLYVIK